MLIQSVPPREHGSLNQLSKAHVGLTGTKVANVGPAWVCTRPSVYMWWLLLAWWFCGTCNSRNRGVSDSRLFLELFLLLGCLGQLPYKDFVLLYLILLCLAVVPWRPVLFWREMGVRGEYGERESVGELGGVERRETLVRIYYMREKSIFSLKKKTVPPATWCTKESFRISISNSFCPWTLSLFSFYSFYLFIF